jgi:pimeloyl-ACP methyl ester carboxylesterase
MKNLNRSMKKSILLLLLTAASLLTFGQAIPYGNNAATGRYFNVGDVPIYYEVYGNGKPLVLLHGGVYGYIDELEYLIPKLAENYQVICIATRGHGKSGIGTAPITYKQWVSDAYKVIRYITADSVSVIGFSDGGFTGLKLAAEHPELVKKLVAMGVGDRPPGRKAEKFSYSAASLLKSDSSFFAGRLKLMPEPYRWNEHLLKLNKVYNESYMSVETFSKIRCPVLLMNGDKDDYSSINSFIDCAKAIKEAQVSIIPGCHHVIFYCNFPAVWESMKPFLDIK